MIYTSDSDKSCNPCQNRLEMKPARMTYAIYSASDVSGFIDRDLRDAQYIEAARKTHQRYPKDLEAAYLYVDVTHAGCYVESVSFLAAHLYNPAMNKRARKRLKESIEKKNLERQKMLKDQSSASSQTKERRGFTVKPEKKRG